MPGLGLDYPSSSDSDNDGSHAGPSAKRRKVSPRPSSPRATKPKTAPKPSKPSKLPPKARKLPSLPSTFDSASAAHNNPAAHQGRLRARPFVDGDYYAHIYFELDISTALRRALDAALAASSPSSTTHSLLDSGKLHVSLSHPLPLRRDAVRAFPSAVQAALGGAGPFALSLAGAPVVYYNTVGGAGPSQAAGRGAPSPGARAFLGLRVGAGTHELAALLVKLEDVLRRMHLPLYHAQPEFHASFGWALCPGLEGSAEAKGEEAEGDGEGREQGDGGGRRDGDKAQQPTPTPFPDALLDRLAKHTDPALAAHSGWRARALSVKIAKDVTQISL